MYTKSVPFKDYRGKPRNMEVNFNLDEREVFKLLSQLKSMFDWMESNQTQEVRDLSMEEVQEFYTNFEAVLLEAWGELSEDGLHFRKGGRFEFEESALFNATMVMFVQEPEETGKLLEGILPPMLKDMVKNADETQIAAATASRAADAEAEVARLRAQLEQQNGTQES